MSQSIEQHVPDIGDFDEVDVVEVLVEPGDRVEVEQSLITLESDKASMEVPATTSGVVREIKVAVGDKIGQGAVIAVIDAEQAIDDAANNTSDAAAATAASPEPTATPSTLAPEQASAAPSAAAVASGTPDLRADVLVLGSGPGGYTAAFRAADLGKRVVMVERYASLGGVCLNVGCIPSKALLHAAKVVDDTADFADHGLSFGKPELDLDKLRSWKDDVVRRLTKGVAGMAKQRDVTVVEGEGHFSSPQILHVTRGDGSTTTIGFESAIIAAGSRVTKIPGWPYDDPRLMDSTDALELRDVPERLLIIGGGIIGLEMATVYHALGSKITVVELLDRLVAGCDADIVRPLQMRLKKRYENIFLGSKVTGITAETEGLRVHFEGKKTPESDVFDRVLVAVGRRPNGHSIGAEAAGVRVDERGFIPVDNQQRTNVPHIFAIGDIAGEPMLAHKASHEGKVAAEVASGERSAFDARVIPSVAYTDPEIAWVGLGEDEAKEKGIGYGVGLFPWAANGRSLSLGRQEGKTKILFDPETQRVLGAGIVGPNAGDLIAEVGLAIEMGCEAEDLGLTIHPHPTLSETVGMAAEVFLGTITDLPPAKKRG